VHLTMRFLDVAYLTTRNPLSLFSSYKLWLSIVGLKMYPLTTLALNSNKIFVWYLGNLSNTRSSYS
jgi:hypothetical protein